MRCGCRRHVAGVASLAVSIIYGESPLQNLISSDLLHKYVKYKWNANEAGTEEGQREGSFDNGA